MITKDDEDQPVIRYYLHDALGSFVAMTDEDQNITALYQSDAWGKELLATEDTLNPYRWNGASGYYWDADSQMYLLGMRWYDVQIGRFASRDPIGLASSDANLLRYVRNNPVKYTDPDGLDGIDFRRFIPPIEIPLPKFPPVEVRLPNLFDFFKDKFRKNIPVRAVCSGYLAFAASSCSGKPDTYPAKAFICCQDFVQKYSNSPDVLCVAACLETAEAGCQSESSCDARSRCRIKAHTQCYAQCKFIPRLGVPASCLAIGILGK
jgi:RHS repeat-associated protein